MGKNGEKWGKMGENGGKWGGNGEEMGGKGTGCTTQVSLFSPIFPHFPPFPPHFPPFSPIFPHFPPFSLAMGTLWVRLWVQYPPPEPGTSEPCYRSYRAGYGGSRGSSHFTASSHVAGTSEENTEEEAIERGDTVQEAGSFECISRDSCAAHFPVQVEEWASVVRAVFLHVQSVIHQSKIYFFSFAEHGLGFPPYVSLWIVSVCVFPCASAKLPDTCRHLPNNFCDTCRHLPWQVLVKSMGRAGQWVCVPRAARGRVKSEDCGDGPKCIGSATSRWSQSGVPSPCC